MMTSIPSGVTDVRNIDCDILFLDKSVKDFLVLGIVLSMAEPTLAK